MEGEVNINKKLEVYRVTKIADYWRLMEFNPNTGLWRIESTYGTKREAQRAANRMGEDARTWRVE
jgi:hypothetical protein